MPPKGKPKTSPGPGDGPAPAPDPEPKATDAEQVTPKATSRGSVTIPPVLTWTLVTFGAWLVYASIRGLSPLAEFKAALTGSPSPGPRNPNDASQFSSQADFIAAVQSGEIGLVPRRDASLKAPSGSTAGVQLVSIGQGSHKLAPAAATAFRTAEGIFGQSIPITDSYRSTEAQAAGYAKAPGRFAPPGKSYHERGTAVDVNLGALGISASDPNQAAWRRLYAAMTAAGWCNPRGPYQGDHKEWWHFSYGGCG